MLLEREGLLETLHGHLGDAIRGTGSIVLVAGEAGAGKTSLVRAFVGSLDESHLVIQGACDPLSTPRPLSPLHDFATDAGSGLGDLITADLTPIEMFEMVLARLRNTIRPIVLVIEDIHWADDGTLDFLRFIGRRVGDTKSVVVCTYRDDEVGADHVLRTLLGQLIPLTSTHRLVVPPLSLTAVTRLAGDATIEPETLLRLTDGNAFYVTEILASGSTSPGSVQEAVMARVGLLDERPRRVVEGVSIAPRSLDIRMASTLVGGTLDDIDAALAAGVLVGDGRSLRFRHELARSAVEMSIPPARRLSLHLRMLALLEEDETVDLARMAHHAVRADDAARILEHAPAAAREASTRGAHREAVSFYEATLPHLKPGDDDQAASLRLELARELSILDQTERARPHVEWAVGHYRSSGQHRMLARALRRLSSVQWRLDAAEAARTSLNEAMAVLEDAGSVPELAETLYESAYLDMLARHLSAARGHMNEAREVAHASGHRDLWWSIEMIDGTIEIVLGDPTAGVSRLRRSLEEARTAKDTNRIQAALSMLGSGGGEARVYQHAIPALEESVEHGLATDEDYSVAYARSWLARIAFEQGRWDEAVQHAEMVQKTSLQPTGIAYITAMSALGRVRVRRGDPGGLETLDEMAKLARVHELQHGWNAICGLAEHHWLSGRPQLGLEALANAYERALDTDSQWARGEIGYWMWSCGAIDRPPDGAAHPFALQMEGRWEEAAAAWRNMGCPYEVALSLADGDEEAMLEAVSILDGLGAAPMARIVRTRLRVAGVDSIPRGPIKSTVANPGGLTGRQLEVLGLMVEGLSNGEIAERLFLSKKTVEHHVSAIFTKLGVDSRSRAIAVAGASLQSEN